MKRKSILKEIDIDLLRRSPYQPRQHFDPEKLQELAQSIQSTGGLLQPIVVRALSDGRYEIVAGERRFRAAQIAGLSSVSCLVCDYTNEQALQAAIVENINRADLNPIEEAQAYQRLIDEFHYLHEEIAASVGKSRAVITNSLRLLKLDKRVQQWLIQGLLTEGHGKVLAGLFPHQQLELAQKAVENAWNVRKMEMAAKKMEAKTPDPSPYSDTNLKHLEIELGEHLGNRVQIEYEHQGGGYMRIRFNNIDELQGHFERIGFKYE